MKKFSPKTLASRLKRGETLTAVEHNMLHARPRPVRRKPKKPARGKG